MADISAELAAIKSAVYGEEVRDSIHNGLYKMNSDLNEAIGTQVIDRATVDSIIEENLTSPLAFMQESIGSATEEITGAKIATFTHQGYFYSADVGSSVTFVESANYVSAKFPVASGDVVTINATGGAGRQRLYSFIDSSGNALNLCSTNLSGKRTVTAPANSVYIAINNVLASQPSGYYAYTGEAGKMELDDAPSASSEHAVKSSGIYTAIEDSMDSAKNMLPASIVTYWPSVKSEAGNSAGTFKGTLSGSLLTIVASVATTQPNTVFKLDGAFEYAAKTNAQISDYVSGLTRTVPLVAGQKYKLTVSHVSGSYDASSSDNPGAAYLRAYLIQSGISSVNDAVAFANIGSSKIFTPSTNMTAALAFIIYVKKVAVNNLVVKIELERASDAIELDDVPTENSTNGVTSGGVYSAIQDVASQGSMPPSYYFESDYLQGKIDTITQIQNTMGAKNDAFWFISDYHHQHNEGHSLALIKYLSNYTGITKLIYAGDAGGSQGTTQAAVYHRIQKSAEVWNLMAASVDEFYGVLGNHEWIRSEYGTLAGMFGAYLNRYKTIAVMDETSGAYYIDNKANKIRYFFLQDNSSSYPVDGTVSWFANQLFLVPDGYSIVVVMHYGYVPNTVTVNEFDGYNPSYNYATVLNISRLLRACKAKINATSTLGYDFSQLNGTRHVIGIFSGHIHHSYLYTGSTVSDMKNIAVFEASTDCLLGGLQELSLNGHPWYWQNGIVGGTKVERLAGTVNEQCFYAVQIDLNAKRLYITAIGGDHDWTGIYEPSES